MKTIALIGNPNCGKTTLFNRLTGLNQTVGNWPGVTVERKSGSLRLMDETLEVIDLPGLYSLSEGGGADEAVARGYLHTFDGLIVNLLDARQLERQLFLTLQLLELGHPILVALGMTDLARAEGMQIDTAALGRALGVPVVELVATSEAGVASLKTALLAPWPGKPATLHYEEPVASALQTLREVLPTATDDQRMAALEGLAMDGAMASQVASVRQRLASQYGDDADIAIADARYTAIGQLMQHVRRSAERSRTSRRLDTVVLHRLWGLPIFLMVMYGLFAWATHVGGAFVDAVDGVADALLVQAPVRALAALGLPDWLGFGLGNGLGEGIKTVATFVPTIGMLYLALGVLEDCGYMARAAFVVDRLMRALGLPGRAFVPMIIGFGCNVPAIMATRTLEGRHARVMAGMMLPFVSCGARLPVYALFATVFFPGDAGGVVMSLYLAGIAVALATGLLLRHSVLRGDATPAVLELPDWHWPSLHSVFKQAWSRLKGFVQGAGSLIVPMVLILAFLGAVDMQGRLRPDAPDDSLLANGARLLTPAFAPIGIQRDNWPAVVGLVTGVLAKEAVAGTLASSYARLAGKAAADETPPALAGQIRDALATIPAKFAELGARLLDPLGLKVAESDVSDQLGAAEGADTALKQRFGSVTAAYAYLLFVLLYTPCVAALAALRREFGWRWMLASAGWTFGMAYTVAASYHHFARAAVPVPWLAISATLSGLVVFGLLQRERNPRQVESC
ncbi:ferrous iron transport protein B [Parachitinimonas caeni]|uniref:Ferrous iron transport protein B n=1 Tax=Parachitinimonas caeni TaxID=3031301 RepID=A0ABT7E2X1_9NEIS|nr:ferrous iron transport protein B [Parachitinimonas caeni]MDK2125663.1 ferrous iron transport protein B [Parachitinimonas caeni]